MKRTAAFIMALVLCTLLVYASADRYVDAADCENVNDFFDAIEMGTTVTVNGYIYLGPFDYDMDGVTGYEIGIYIDIPGCMQRNVFLMASEEQAEGLEKDDYISASGQMFSRGNTGTVYYFNTQLGNGFVKKLDKPEPSILDLNDETYNISSVVQKHHIYDIAKGENLQIVLTDEWQNSSSSETTYYYYMSVGNINVRFHTHTKDLFKGDYIDFEGIIYNYDEKTKTLLCNEPVYQLHENK